MKTAALVLLSSPLIAQGQVHVVDDDGGPGVDFTELQPAIDAALSGDTLLVRDGIYNHVTIDNKSLVVVTDTGSVAVGKLSASSTTVIKNIGAGQSVVLRGVHVENLRLEQSDGAIYVEDCPIGATLTGFGTFNSDPAVDAIACSAVTLVRCTLTGPSNASDLLAALRATSSSVHLYGCSVTGGDGVTTQNTGGGGVEVTDSFLFAAGSTVKGGRGGPATAGSGVCFSGDGGHGLVVIEASEVFYLQTSFTGGPFGDTGPFCGAGSTGLPTLVVSGTLVELAGFQRQYTVSSPAVGGGTAQVTYLGVPSDLVFSVLSLDQQPTYVPILRGTLVPALPVFLYDHGLADAAGSLQASVPIGALPVGLDGFTVHLQAAGFSGTSGLAFLGEPSALTILAAGL